MKFIHTIAGIMLYPCMVLTAEPTEPGAASQPSFFWILAQALFALVIVIGGIFLVVWALKQVMNRTGRGKAVRFSEHFKVVQKLPLSPNQNIYVLRFRDDLILVAAGESEVHPIHRYENFSEWENFARDEQEPPTGFAALFRNAIGQNSAASVNVKNRGN